MLVWTNWIETFFVVVTKIWSTYLLLFFFFLSTYLKLLRKKKIVIFYKKNNLFILQLLLVMWLKLEHGICHWKKLNVLMLVGYLTGNWNGNSWPQLNFIPYLPKTTKTLTLFILLKVLKDNLTQHSLTLIYKTLLTQSDIINFRIKLVPNCNHFFFFSFS